MADADGEWTYLTSDPEQTCAICGAPSGSRRPRGYVDGEVVHARCYRPLEELTDQDG